MGLDVLLLQKTFAQLFVQPNGGAFANQLEVHLLLHGCAKQLGGANSLQRDQTCEGDAFANIQSARRYVCACTPSRLDAQWQGRSPPTSLRLRCTRTQRSASLPGAQ